MSNKNIIVPTKEDVVKLLNLMVNDQMNHMCTVSELLGLKLVDTFLPQIEGEPEWGYEGLKKFFVDNGIDFSCTFESALEKLNR